MSRQLTPGVIQIVARKLLLSKRTSVATYAITPLETLQPRANDSRAS